MILEIDYGNTRVKWRLLNCYTKEIIARGATSNAQELVLQVRHFIQGPIRYCRVCSVRTAYDNGALTDTLLRDFTIAPVYAVSSQLLAGVVNGYMEATKLGVDRWLAVVAAYSEVKTACLVFDFGTAITVDYVNAQGVHLGGCIAPGLQMIKKSLNSGAQQLAGFNEELRGKSAQWGIDTQSAINNGIATMIEGFTQEHLKAAATEWGSQFKTIYTGGDGQSVDCLTANALFDEDLVFKGLSIACPFVEGV